MIQVGVGFIDIGSLQPKQMTIHYREAFWP
jgi:hypothetical protein